VNGDGKPDLATANDYADTVSVLLNTGTGSFGAKRDYKARGNPNSPHRTGGDPVSVAIADLNRDGKPDLATANAAIVDAGTVSVFVNKGRGRFRSELVYATGGPYSIEVAIGDLDGDAKSDVAAANKDASTVSVLFNRPGLCTVQGVWAQPLPPRSGRSRARTAASGRSAGRTPGPSSGAL
jgi:FG-GAP-like repeat